MSLKALEHSQTVVLWRFQPCAQKEGELFEHVGPLWTAIAIRNFPQNAL